MDPDITALCLLGGTAIALLLGTVVLVSRRRTIGNFAALTAYHDFQPREKQRAVEIVVEKKAGKNEKSQESGDAGPTARRGRIMNNNESQ